MWPTSDRSSLFYFHSYHICFCIIWQSNVTTVCHVYKRVITTIYNKNVKPLKISAAAFLARPAEWSLNGSIVVVFFCKKKKKKKKKEWVRESERESSCLHHRRTKVLWEINVYFWRRPKEEEAGRSVSRHWLWGPNTTGFFFSHWCCCICSGVCWTPAGLHYCNKLTFVSENRP